MGVSVLLARIMIEAVARAGADVRAYCSDAGIDAERLSDPLERIEHEQWLRLLELALVYTQDPALGLHIGERLSMNAFGIVGLVSSHAPTLREGIEVLLSYRSLLSDSPPPPLEERGERAFLPYEYVSGSPAVNRLRAELFLSRFVTLGRTFTSPRGSTEICFDYPAPTYVSEYRRTFGRSARFDQARAGIGFPRAWLDLPQFHWDPSLYGVLRDQADRLLKRGGRSLVSERLHLLLLQRREPRPGMPDLARRLGMNERALRRRLAEEGSSFRAIAESALRERTLSLLRDPAPSLKDVVARAGFSEASALYRAVRRWTGLSPVQFRARIARQQPVSERRGKRRQRKSSHR